MGLCMSIIRKCASWVLNWKMQWDKDQKLDWIPERVGVLGGRKPILHVFFLAFSEMMALAGMQVLWESIIYRLQLQRKSCATTHPQSKQPVSSFAKCCQTVKVRAVYGGVRSHPCCIHEDFPRKHLKPVCPWHPWLLPHPHPGLAKQYLHLGWLVL